MSTIRLVRLFRALRDSLGICQTWVPLITDLENRCDLTITKTIWASSIVIADKRCDG